MCTITMVSASKKQAMFRRAVVVSNAVFTMFYWCLALAKRYSECAPPRLTIVVGVTPITVSAINALATQTMLRFTVDVTVAIT